MLKRLHKAKANAPGGHFAVVASRYNAQFVDSMLSAATAVLRDAKADVVEVVRVPGAFEIPVVVSAMARTRRPRWSAIVCLGVIIRGQTEHAQLIANAVTQALMDIQVEQGTPVIHEVLLVENEEQARVRCLDPKHNRGQEAAQTAVEMSLLMRRFGPAKARSE